MRYTLRFVLDLLLKVFRLLSEKDAPLDNAAGDEDPVEDWEDLTDPSTGLGLEGMSLEDTGVGEGKGTVGAVGGGGQAEGEAGVMDVDATGLDMEDDHEGVEEEEEDRGQEESMEVIDERLMLSFLNGLKKGLKDAQLPMLVR